MFLISNQDYRNSVFISFILFQLLKIGEGKDCPSYYSESIKDNCGGCGLCRRYLVNETYTNKCDYSFTNQVFNPNSGKKCEVVNYCEKEKPCKNLPCEPITSSFRCVCDAKKYGKLCNHDIGDANPLHLAVVENILYTPIFYHYSYVVISVLFRSPGRSLQVHVNTYKESLVFDMRKCEKMDQGQLCSKWYGSFPKICSKADIDWKSVECVINIFLPYEGHNLRPPRVKVAIGDEEEYSAGIYGAKEFLSLSVYNTIAGKVDKPVYEIDQFNVINLFIHPKRDQCYCSTVIHNAAHSMSGRVKVPKWNEVWLSECFFHCEEKYCRVTLTARAHWKVWKMDINHNELSHEMIVTEGYEEKEISFSPFSLDFGLYKVLLNVSYWFKNEDHFSNAYAYFEVVPMKINAVLQGGEQLSIYYKTDSVTLNASLSNDPNIPRSEQKDNLIFHWKCDQKTAFCKDKISGPVVIYPGPFDKNQNYIFTLKVYSKKNPTLSQEVYKKIYMSTIPVPTLEIRCKRNCGSGGYLSNPAEIIWLEAFISYLPENVKTNYIFTWMYRVEAETKFLPIQDTRSINKLYSMLFIPSNTLAKGETYRFRVQSDGDSPGEATYIIRTAKQQNNFSCKPSIMFGEETIGISEEFDISCDQVYVNNLSPIYEFYDKYPDKEDTGRLFAIGYSNFANDICLTRGKVAVVVTDCYGITQEYEMIAKVGLKGVSTKKFITQQMKDLRLYGSLWDLHYRSSKISCIVDTIWNENYNLDVPPILEKLLQQVDEDRVSSIQGLKIWTDLTRNIAKVGEKYFLTKDSVNFLSKSLTKISTRLHEESSHIDMIKYFTSADINFYSECVLDIANAIFNSRNDDLSSGNMKQEKFYDSYTLYKESAEQTIKALLRTMLALSTSSIPFQPPFMKKQGSITLWSKVDTPHNFYSSSINKAENGSMQSVFITLSLSNFLQRQAQLIEIQMILFDDDPYWWDQTRGVHTNVIDLSIYNRDTSEGREIKRLMYPIEITLKQGDYSGQIISGSVEQPNPNESIHIADKKVAIHQLKNTQFGRLDLHFTNMMEEQVLKVLVLLNMRPDYDFMVKEAVTITKSTPDHQFELRDPHTSDIFDFYYLGILPGPDHKMESALQKTQLRDLFHSQALKNNQPRVSLRYSIITWGGAGFSALERVQVPVGEVVNYTFQMTAHHCVSWRFNEWSTHGCKIKNIKYTTSEMVCECTHLSSFAGFCDIPINTINPITDIVLLVTIVENPYGVIVVVTLLAVYFILLVWAKRADSKEKIKQSAVYLEDNFSYDNFPYLIAVYTGTRFFAGTTSNVGFKILGEKAKSRPHILKSKHYKVLERGDDNWFLLFTPSPLGRLRKVHIWIDHSGGSPSWFCDKIIVVDLLEDLEYTFVVDSWLSLSQDEYVQKLIGFSRKKDEKQIDLVTDNLVLGFREAHVWFSAFNSHPRSSVNRTQRLSVAFLGIFVTLLISCMFYGVLDDGYAENSQYSLTTKILIVAVITMVITVLTINISISLFRKTVLYDPDSTYIEDEEPKNADKTQNISKEDSLDVSQQLLAKDPTIVHVKKYSRSSIKGTTQRCCDAIRAIFIRRKKFMPVHLNIDILGVKDERNKTVRFWSILAWTNCLSLMIICSYLIILYSLKFGKVKCLEWLTSVLFSFLEVNMLVAPLKIATFATLSGLLATNIYEVVTYYINYELVMEYKQRTTKEDPDSDFKVINLRKNRMYLPLSFEDVMEKRSRQKKNDAAWLILDMFLISAVIGIMILQNSTLWTTKYYWNNHQLSKQLKQAINDKGTNVKGVQFNSHTNITKYPVFLQEKVFPLLYQSKWYNGDPFINGLCTKQSIQNLPKLCPNRITEDTEDNDIFGPGWISTITYQEYFKTSPWKYMTDNETCDMSLFGHLWTKYRGDGYVAELSMGRFISNDVIKYLIEEGWVDHRTVVFFFEMSSYNANTGAISCLISVTESLHIGMLMTKFYVFSVDDEYNVSAIHIILFLSIFTFIIRVLFSINRRGIKQIFTNGESVFDLIIAVLCVALIVYFVKNIEASANYLHSYINKHDEDYFQFLHLITGLDEMRYILVILTLMLVCRLMKSWRFGRRFILYLVTFLISWKTLFWIFITFTMFLFVYWRLFSYHLNLFIMSNNRFILINKTDFRHIVYNAIYIQDKFHPFILCSISYLPHLLTIILFLRSYTIVNMYR